MAVPGLPVMPGCHAQVAHNRTSSRGCGTWPPFPGQGRVKGFGYTSQVKQCKFFFGVENDLWPLLIVSVGIASEFEKFLSKFMLELLFLCCKNVIVHHLIYYSVQLMF